MGLLEQQMMMTLTRTTLPEREREITAICGAEARYEIDWESISSDGTALRFLDHLTLHRTSQALRDLSEEPETREALRHRLKAVRLKNVPTRQQMKLDFADGVLEIHCAFGLRKQGAFEPRDIRDTLSQHLQ